MNEAFILHLRGPLQSYADQGFGPIREAGGFPSRSAVLGIVAAALGIPRYDARLVALHDASLVHVATLRSGAIHTDFHTVDAGAKNKAVTYRDYFHDAHFAALIEARTSADADTIGGARNALRRPRYVSFLGRRACVPSRPLLPCDVSEPHPLASLLTAAREADASPAGVRVFLDGRFTSDEVNAAAKDAIKVGEGERRDRLVQPARTYTGRLYTEVRLQPPSDGPDVQQDFFDAAS